MNRYRAASRRDASRGSLATFVAALVVMTYAAHVAQAETSAPFFVTFVPGQGRAVLAERGGRVLLLGVPDLEVQREFSGPPGSKLGGVAVSGNGRWLAVDYLKGEVLVWNLDSGERQAPIEKAWPRSKQVMLFHPAADQLLLFQGDHLESWDLAAGTHEPILSRVTNVTRMSLSPDGERLVVSGRGGCKGSRRRHDFCVLSFADGVVVALGDQSHMLGGRGLFSVEELAATADGRILLVASFGYGDFVPFELAMDDLRVLEGGNYHFDSLRLAIEEFWIDERDLPFVSELWRARGHRSTPRDQWRDMSSDGRWSLHLPSATKRLYLYAIPEDGGWEAKALSKFMPVP